MLQTQACKAVALLLSALSLSPVSIAKGSPRVSVPRSSSNSSGQRTWQINRGHRAYKLKPPSPPLAIKTEPNLEKSILNADFQVWTTLAIYHFISRQHLSPNACSLPFQALPPRRSLAGMQEHHLLHVCEPEPVYTQFKKNTKRSFFLEKKYAVQTSNMLFFISKNATLQASWFTNSFIIYGGGKIKTGQKNPRCIWKVKLSTWDLWEYREGEISAYFIPYLVVSTETNDCCLGVSAEQAENTVVSPKL